MEEEGNDGKGDDVVEEVVNGIFIPSRSDLRRRGAVRAPRAVLFPASSTWGCRVGDDDRPGAAEDVPNDLPDLIITIGGSIAVDDGTSS